MNTRLKRWRDTPRQDKLIASLVGCAALVGGVTALLGGVALVRMAMRGDIRPEALLIGVPAAVLAWLISVVLPLAGTRMLRRGRRGGAALLFLAIASLVAIGIGSTGQGIVTTIVVFATAAALAASLFIVWTYRFQRCSPPRNTNELEAHRKNTKIALRYLLLGGIAGLHAFYLGKSWKGLLYLALLSLAFVSWTFLAAGIFAAVSLAMLVWDDFNVAADVDSANEAREWH